MTQQNFIFTFLFALIFVTLGHAQQGQVTVTQDSAIDKLLDYKKDIRTSKVYKIHVYQSTDPDMVTRKKYEFLDTYNNWPVEIEWQKPNYKVWVGNFTTRLEADRALAEIKKDYINATVFQPKSNDE